MESHPLLMHAPTEKQTPANTRFEVWQREPASYLDGSSNDIRWGVVEAEDFRRACVKLAKEQGRKEPRRSDEVMISREGGALLYCLLPDGKRNFLPDYKPS